MHNYPSSQKEASTLAGRLSQIGTGYAWNLSKPDTRSRLAGGVCTPHHARRKGYSDFVQDTGPVMSGQLRVSFRPAQTLRVTFGYSQTAHNSYRVEQSLCRRNSRVQSGRNSLMGLNYSELRELDNSLISSTPTNGGSWLNSLILPQTCTAVSRYNLLNVSGNAAGVCRETKHDGSPSLEVPTKSAGSWWDGADLLHEKGNAANVALWDDCFFSHQENQHLAEPQGNRKPNLAYEQNQQLAESNDNYTGISGEVDRLSLSESVNLPSLSDLVHYISLRDAVQPLRLEVLQEFRKTCSGANYETFVGQGVTDRKPVQPSGVSLAFLRCSALSLRPQASSTQAEKLALGFSGFSRSTLASISSINSCGKRIPFKLDLLLTFFVAIGFSPRWCVSTIHKSGENKTLDVLEHSGLWCSNTLSTGKAQETHKIATPRSGGTLPRRLTTNVSHSNEAATMDITTPLTGRNSLTPNKFTWRFLAISRSDRNAKPCRLSVEAHTEREARQVLAPHFILSLAARLPVQGIREIVTPSAIAVSQHLQGIGEIPIPSTIGKTSTVREVGHA